MVETGGTQVKGQPGLHSNMLSLKKQKQNQKTPKYSSSYPIQHLEQRFSLY
jgi:hypothetical protein